MDLNVSAILLLKLVVLSSFFNSFSEIFFTFNLCYTFANINNILAGKLFVLLQHKNSSRRGSNNSFNFVHFIVQTCL